MILCDGEIKTALAHKQIIIDPLPSEQNFSTTAVDLTPGKVFYRWNLQSGRGLSLRFDPGDPEFKFHESAETSTEPVITDSSGRIEIAPHQLILTQTEERIEIPEISRLAARVEGKSSLARLGLVVHLTAPTIHGGFRGNITLEINNFGPIPILLRPGMPICQLVFELVFGTPTKNMVGNFQDQTSPIGK